MTTNPGLLINLPAPSESSSMSSSLDLSYTPDPDAISIQSGTGNREMDDLGPSETLPHIPSFKVAWNEPSYEFQVVMKTPDGASDLDLGLTICSTFEDENDDKFHHRVKSVVAGSHAAEMTLV